MICHLVDFLEFTHHRTKVKNGKKLVKFLDLALELKELWNMKLVSTADEALATVPQNLE